jgi:hypothetical protein
MWGGSRLQDSAVGVSVGATGAIVYCHGLRGRYALPRRRTTACQSTIIQSIQPMKTVQYVLAFVLASFLTTLPAVSADQAAKSKRLLHVVAFKFKTSASKEQIDQAVAAFRDLPQKIPAIQSFEWGTNVSPEKHDKGFTHGFVLSFKSEKGRDEYLVHPDHKAFGKKLGPIIDDVFVIDYWAQN